MIFKCHDCESEFDEKYAVYYGHLRNPRCPVCGSSVAGIRLADLPEAGASAERISSVVRSNATTGWISVKDRLPEIEEEVLILTKSKSIYNGRLMEDCFLEKHFEGWQKDSVTHWMPLPEPPEV